jgi:AcrR family transcriptional regulator
MRRRILDAARQLFARDGVDKVTLRRIASRIGYSPAALYRYYRNKKEILSALREEGFARFAELQKRAGETFRDPVERLRARARGYVRFARSEPDSYRLMFSSTGDQVDLECAATGWFGEVDADALAFALWGQLHGLVHLAATGQAAVLGHGANLDAQADRIIEFGLRPGNNCKPCLSES